MKALSSLPSLPSLPLWFHDLLGKLLYFFHVSDIFFIFFVFLELVNFSRFETALICTVALRGAALHVMAILQLKARNSRVKFVTDDSLNFYFPNLFFRILFKSRSSGFTWTLPVRRITYLFVYFISLFFFTILVLVFLHL